MTLPRARHPAILAVLTLTAALIGCAVGPDYHRPDVDVQLPARWSEEGITWKVGEPRDAQPRGAWWEAFGDATLNALAEQALTANQDLRAAMARVMEARALARIEAAELLPEASVSPSADRFRRTRSSFGSAGGFTITQYSVPWDLSYEVDLWGRVRRAFEAAGADAQASEAAYHSILLTLTADVAARYVALRELDAEIDVLERTLTLRRDARELVSRRVETGVVSALDLARADTELAQADTDLIDVRRQREELEHALAVLCGQPASTFTIAPGSLDLSPPSVPLGVPSELLERRPDVAEAEREMMAANARVGVAKAAFFPVVSLTGSAGWQNAVLDDLVTADSLVWSLGPKISLPLFTGGRNTAGLNAARARYDETVAAYRQQILVAIEEVENALASVRRRGEQAEGQRRVVEAVLKSTELSQARYSQGLVNYLEVVDAERLRLEAELGAVRILSQRLTATILLIKSLGGGWDAADREVSDRADPAQARADQDQPIRIHLTTPEPW